MKLYPFDECAKEAFDRMQAGATVYQQWNCAHCGVKQTMGVHSRHFEAPASTALFYRCCERAR